ncbi:hypothetical protein G7046_g9034 [Stylonectria norvegica]|nr:hypothetical protein G7046_g9034 [Stylonectria norvegica]
MIPEKPLPYNGDYSSPEEYVEKLLDFVATSDTFQILCGGVHILDFFTIEPGLFHHTLPEEWQAFVLTCGIMEFLDLLMRDDLDNLHYDEDKRPPESFIKYIRTVRDLSLGRTFTPPGHKLPVLPRPITVGMSPKKVHEVTNFADYVERLSGDIASQCGDDISHFVDFGSGQNYLGRALASEPYNRHVVAVEGREINVTAARGLDITSKLAIKPKVMRNKKLWNKIIQSLGPNPKGDEMALAKAIRDVAGDDAFDFRPVKDLGAEYAVEDGKGHVQYISGRLDSGDLADVIAQIKTGKSPEAQEKDLKLMAVSIHSCGNLSHFGIRSLVLNPSIRAVAIVGCCYNALTEKLGPPTYKHPYLRPTLKAVNGRVVRESEKRDPQGFPMSARLAEYGADGIRVNITARMMACQAPRNWGEIDSEGFFARHFYRAVLQRMFLDRGVVAKVRHFEPDAYAQPVDAGAGPFEVSTEPVIIGSLRKACYDSLGAYVRGAIEKLTTHPDYTQYAEVMRAKMADVTDEEILRYEELYTPRRRELCAVWSLMAFSAMAIESLIVVDRWLWLREQGDVVRHAWVETVFDYEQSPRNLVVRKDVSLDVLTQSHDCLVVGSELQIKLLQLGARVGFGGYWTRRDGGGGGGICARERAMSCVNRQAFPNPGCSRAWGGVLFRGFGWRIQNWELGERPKLWRWVYVGVGVGDNRDECALSVCLPSSRFSSPHRRPVSPGGSDSGVLTIPRLLGRPASPRLSASRGSRGGDAAPIAIVPSRLACMAPGSASSPHSESALRGAPQRHDCGGHGVDGTYTLIHIPLDLYSTLLQPILRILLPQSQSIQGSRDNSPEFELGGLTADCQHGFLNVSVTPIECSVVCHSSWAANVFEPVIRSLPRDAARQVSVSHDSYMILSVISAGLDAAGRVMELTSPLALAGIPIFFITTYYSDFILVPTKERQNVVQTLLAKGFELSAENESSFVTPGAYGHKRGNSSRASSPPNTPPPSNVGELQARTFGLLRKRNIAPYIAEGLELVQCSGREISQLSSAYQRPSVSRQPPASTRRPSWADNVDTKLYTCIIAALVSQPRFMSITLAQEDPPSLLLDKTLLDVFGDTLVGDTEGRLIPIFLDLANLPFEVTGIVCGVAGRLVQDMQMAESSELSYLSTARAGAVILSEEQSIRALGILQPLLDKEA